MSVRETIQNNVVGISGTTASWIGVITARQEQLEWGLRCASYIGAIVVSAVTIFHLFKNKRR
jgi:hypothetical protein